MAEGGAFTNLTGETEDVPGVTDTGNFSTALANLFTYLEKYRRTEPKPPGQESDDDAEPDIHENGEEPNDSEASKESDDGDSSSSDDDDDDDESSSSDGIDSSSSDTDSDFENTDGIEAFTRLDLDGILEEATQRVNLKKLYKPGEYEDLCRFLKHRVMRIENKLTLMLELKLPLPCEEIIREKLGLPSLHPLQLESSDSDSDEDWRATKPKKKNMPIFRGVTEDGSRARMAFIQKYVEERQDGKRPAPAHPERRIVKATRRRKVKEVRKPSFELFKEASKTDPTPDESGDGPSTSRYDTRPRPDVKYTEEYVPEDDHFVFCDDCQSMYVDDCPDHPLTKMKDPEVKMGSVNRAKLTCPPGLSVDPSSVRNAGYGVWCDIPISRNTVFGPYEGDIIKKYDIKNLGKVCDGGYSWEIYKKGKLLHYLDGSNQRTSNWMRYVNCARNEEEQNLIAFQYKGQIYYRAFIDIKANVEFFVWYGSHYAKQLGIDCKMSNTKFEKSSCDQMKNSLARLAIEPQPEVELKIQKDVTLVKEKSGKWKCHICGKVLSRKQGLECHIKTVHDKVTDFQCTVCGKACSSNANLVKHRRVHSGEKPYTCKECGASFAQSINLKNHERTHTGEKPYKCKQCGERFAQRSHLQGHERIHTGEKPFACKWCGRRFAQRSDQKIHERTHTGEKPYKCEDCGKRFTKFSHLKRHKRLHSFK